MSERLPAIKVVMMPKDTNAYLIHTRATAHSSLVLFRLVKLSASSIPARRTSKSSVRRT